MKPSSNTYFGRYLIYLRTASTGLLIAPVSSQLWHEFVDHALDAVITLITFAFLLACIVIYPISVPLFALAACENDRRSAIKRAEFLKRMNRGCTDWRDEADPTTFFGLDPASGPDQTVHVRREWDENTERYYKLCEKAPPGWYCSRRAGHDGPCAAVEESAL